MNIPHYNATSLPEPRCRRCRRMAGFTLGSILVLILSWTPTLSHWVGHPTYPPRAPHVQSPACAPNCPGCYRNANGDSLTPGGSVGIRV